MDTQLTSQPTAAVDMNPLWITDFPDTLGEFRHADLVNAAANSAPTVPSRVNTIPVHEEIHCPAD